jgi:hypothetical protein
MISVGLEAGKPPLLEQECSKLFIGKYKETRNTLEWVEVAWRFPTDTIQWLGGGSMARIWPGKAPLEVYRDPPKGNKW